MVFEVFVEAACGAFIPLPKDLVSLLPALFNLTWPWLLSAVDLNDKDVEVLLPLGAGSAMLSV